MKLVYLAKDRRKELVSALETLTQETATYLKAPTYNYIVAGYTVTRDGNIIVPEDADEAETQELIDSLQNMGFTCIMTETHADLIDSPVKTQDADEEEASPDEADTVNPEDDKSDEEIETGDVEFVDVIADSEDSDENKPEPENPVDDLDVEDEDVKPVPADSAEGPETENDEPTQITLSYPISLFAQDAIDRMKALIASKQSLLKKALDTDNLDITTDGDKVIFPWFTDHGIEGEVKAYADLTRAIAMKAITQNRVNATEKQSSLSEKDAMRILLVRLDLKGEEYRTTRAILMRNFNNSNAQKRITAIDLGMPEVTTLEQKKETEHLEEES